MTLGTVLGDYFRIADDMAHNSPHVSTVPGHLDDFPRICLIPRQLRVIIEFCGRSVLSDFHFVAIHAIARHVAGAFEIMRGMECIIIP